MISTQRVAIGIGIGIAIGILPLSGKADTDCDTDANLYGLKWPSLFYTLGSARAFDKPAPYFNPKVSGKREDSNVLDSQDSSE